MTISPNGRHVAENPHLKASARRALRYAVASAKVQRAEHCSSCLQPILQVAVVNKRRLVFRANLVAHHSDYAKPLDVIWLCQHCHMRKHWPWKDSRANKDSLVARTKKTERAILMAFLGDIPPEFRFGDIAKFLQVEVAA